MKHLEIAAVERGKLHLLALNTDPGEGPDDGPDPRPADLLDMPDLDLDYAEVLAIEDLGDMTLSDYLQEGYDVSEETLKPHATRLNALAGHVLVVLSLAFRDAATRIPLGPEMSHICTLATEGPDWTAPTLLETDSAAPSASARKRPSDGAMMGRVAMVALLVLFALTGVMIWVASLG